ncbi:S-layer homology domain-containing protein [Paenibacillus silvisoli]|uniref:S-layer homology domain-containing protein n=1 Tax=Paenibacillus silvisoli TaxID=3110539 RepID=UPI0028060EE6|nr:S-layer homology domain-containing protein [Paenibacillus silvisoli]
MLAAGLQPDKTAKASFADIKQNEWHTPYIEAAKTYLSGFTRNDGQFVFKPSSPALREDIAVAVVKLAGLNKATASDHGSVKKLFKDAAGISEYAKDYVVLAVENGLISGFPDDTFRAQQPISRAQAAAILYRLYRDDNESPNTAASEDVIR